MQVVLLNHYIDSRVFKNHKGEAKSEFALPNNL